MSTTLFANVQSNYKINKIKNINSGAFNPANVKNEKNNIWTGYFYKEFMKF